MFLVNDNKDIKDFLAAVNFISPKGMSISYFISPDKMQLPPDSGFQPQQLKIEKPDDESQIYVRTQPVQKIDQSITPGEYSTWEPEELKRRQPTPNILPNITQPEDLQSPFVKILSESKMFGTDIKLLEDFGPFKKNTVFHCVPNKISESKLDEANGFGPGASPGSMTGERRQKTIFDYDEDMSDEDMINAVIEDYMKDNLSFSRASVILQNECGLSKQKAEAILDGDDAYINDLSKLGENKLKETTLAQMKAIDQALIEISNALDNDNISPIATMNLLKITKVLEIQLQKIKSDFRNQISDQQLEKILNKLDLAAENCDEETARNINKAIYSLEAIYSGPNLSEPIKEAITFKKSELSKLRIVEGLEDYLDEGEELPDSPVKKFTKSAKYPPTPEGFRNFVRQNSWSNAQGPAALNKMMKRFQNTHGFSDDVRKNIWYLSQKRAKERNEDGSFSLVTLTNEEYDNIKDLGPSDLEGTILYSDLFDDGPKFLGEAKVFTKQSPQGATPNVDPETAVDQLKKVPGAVASNLKPPENLLEDTGIRDRPGFAVAVDAREKPLSKNLSLNIPEEKARAVKHVQRGDMVKLYPLGGTTPADDLRRQASEDALERDRIKTGRGDKVTLQNIKDPSKTTQVDASKVDAILSTGKWELLKENTFERIYRTNYKG